jgi:hypothetical protein
MGWTVIFMLVVLKLPVVYLAGVVWWAIRAEPRPTPEDGLRVASPDAPPPASPWLWGRRGGRLRPSRGGPHGHRPRTPRDPRPLAAKAERR